jgi:type III secretion system FlhB-like substrate exporter
MANAPKIDRRDDINPTEGEHKYGDVNGTAIRFVDRTNKKYPIDTPEQVRAAWNYINHKDNADKYDADEVTVIKERIKKAAKKHDVPIHDDQLRVISGRVVRLLNNLPALDMATVNKPRLDNDLSRIQGR